MSTTRILSPWNNPSRRAFSQLLWFSPHQYEPWSQHSWCCHLCHSEINWSENSYGELCQKSVWSGKTEYLVTSSWWETSLTSRSLSSPHVSMSPSHVKCMYVLVIYLYLVFCLLLMTRSTAAQYLLEKSSFPFLAAKKQLWNSRRANNCV